MPAIALQFAPLHTSLLSHAPPAAQKQLRGWRWQLMMINIIIVVVIISIIIIIIIHHRMSSSAAKQMVTLHQ